jgi:hypothetical protein
MELGKQQFLEGHLYYKQIMIDSSIISALAIASSNMKSDTNCQSKILITIPSRKA